MVDSAKPPIWTVFTPFIRPASRDDDAPYQAFTRQFDVETDATDLDRVLGPLTSEVRRTFDLAWEELNSGLLAWRTRVQLFAVEAAARVRTVLSADERDNMVVSLLVDQSGSMAGQKILFTAAAVDVAQEFLRSLRIKTEVLGFTTVNWRGGEARKRWQLLGRPRNPGRLNDLLHVIYRDADDLRASAGGHAFRPMLRPDLLKENVDGEAVQWALARLRRRPEPRKVLVVVSDGAPVDDSTLDANRHDYLDAHLRAVLTDARASADVTVIAVGVGFDVSTYYPGAPSVEAADDLGAALIGLLERTLAPTKAAG